MRLRFIPQTMVVLLAAACAAGPATTTAPHRTTSRSVLSGDELRAARVTNAYEAVHRLRPEFARARGTASMSPFSQARVGVFANGVYVGGLEVLRMFSALEIVSIKRMSLSETTVRYGTRYGGIEGLEITTSPTGFVNGR